MNSNLPRESVLDLLEGDSQLLAIFWRGVGRLYMNTDIDWLSLSDGNPSIFWWICQLGLREEINDGLFPKEVETGSLISSQYSDGWRYNINEVLGEI